MNPLAIIGVATPILLAIIGLNVYFVRSTVRTEIAEANAQQLQQINGTYVRSAGSRMTGAEIERALHGHGKVR